MLWNRKLFITVPVPVLTFEKFFIYEVLYHGPDLHYRSCKSATSYNRFMPIFLIPVLWIHDILVWIRIRGSVPLTYGSKADQDPVFSSLTDKKPTKNNFSLFISFLFLKVQLLQSSKIILFCLLMEGFGSGSVQIITDQDLRGLKTYGSGSTTLVIPTRGCGWKLQRTDSHLF